MNIMSNLKNRVTLIVAVLLVVVGLGLVINKKNMESPYSVVYLATGEVYVGQLSTLPDFELKNAYILQVTKDATDPAKNNFQITPVSDALWAPESLHLVKKNIVFYGRLEKTSKIAETIAAKAVK